MRHIMGFVMEAPDPCQRLRPHTSELAAFLALFCWALQNVLLLASLPILDQTVAVAEARKLGFLSS